MLPCGRAAGYSHRMRGDVQRILIPQERIAQRVRELAGQITADFQGNGSMGGGGEVTIVPVLTGAMIFCADFPSP